MNKLGYPIVILPLSAEDGGGFMAYAPDLRGCMSDGESQEEAARNVADAISEWLDEAVESGIEVPLPYSASKRVAEIRQRLYDAVMRQADKIEMLEDENVELKRLVDELKDGELKGWMDCDPALLRGSSAATAVRSISAH